MIADPDFQAKELVFYHVPAGFKEKGSILPKELLISPYPDTNELGNDIFYLDIIYIIEAHRIDRPTSEFISSFNKQAEVISFAVCIDIKIENYTKNYNSEVKVHILIATFNPIRSVFLADAIVKMLDTWTQQEYPVTLTELTALVAKEREVPQMLRFLTIETFKCSTLTRFLIENFDTIYHKFDFCIE